MNETLLIQTLLFIAFVLSFITNLYYSKNMKTMQKKLFEAYKDNPEVKQYIQHDLQHVSTIEAIKLLRIKYGFSIEGAKRMVDMYK
ncbi:hypothetical protein SK066_22350 [Paenibacillus hunanensis]|uniref:hypothetical protein n=1 Tax=Paenibacillus hunanensis TaxID=539262 RepID=UPI002A6A1098|nr:hypothetical protein [Paenibacillus hunanensis]WPP41262.1 hypothetical protein SK066_22350 [Paenibacillus hunanensis]